jgi:hypothetical protein
MIGCEEGSDGLSFSGMLFIPSFMKIEQILSVISVYEFKQMSDGKQNLKGENVTVTSEPWTSDICENLLCKFGFNIHLLQMSNCCMEP